MQNDTHYDAKWCEMISWQIRLKFVKSVRDRNFCRISFLVVTIKTEITVLLYLFMTSNQLSACSINSANLSISWSLLNNSLMASTTDFDNNSIHNLTFCLKLRYIATSQLKPLWINITSPKTDHRLQKGVKAFMNSYLYFIILRNVFTNHLYTE